MARRGEGGLRERKKLATKQRIRAAAAALFARHGYAAATLRQIAQRAHVALGTLFNYADDKRDLVFLIFNDELDALTDLALAAPRPGDSLVDQLVSLFATHYRGLRERLTLSRILLQELTFYSAGKQSARFHAIRRRLVDGIERIVREAQQSGRILTKEDPQVIARHIFFVYSAAIRWWIAARSPDPARGLTDLRRLLELQVGGLEPAPGERVRFAARRRRATGRTRQKK